MKSETRAWIIFVLLLIFWRTLPVSPFNYFAGMIRDWFDLVAGQPFLPPVWQVLISFLMISLLLTALLLVGRTRSRLYLAGICALAEMAHHLVVCIKTNQIYAVSPAIAIGLALALLFLIIKAKSPGLWLSDAFVLALPAWLIHDSVLPPLFRLLGLDKGSVADWFLFTDSPMIAIMDDRLGLPTIVWSIIPLALAALPMIFFTRKRMKG